LSQICEEVRIVVTWAWNFYSNLTNLILQLFDECLSPNTLGDGTGCDNMTAIIVRLDRFLPEDKTSSSETILASHSVKRPLTEDNSTDVAQPESEGNYWLFGSLQH
jgi:protein phosphatase 1G